jgi:hypothetical protein
MTLPRSASTSLPASVLMRLLGSLLCCFPEEFFYFRPDLFRRFRAALTFFNPRSPWVNGVPTGTQLIVSPLSRVMIAKTVNKFIPDRTKFCD